MNTTSERQSLGLSPSQTEVGAIGDGAKQETEPTFAPPGTPHRLVPFPRLEDVSAL